jgi:hypothetical protein
MLTRLPIWEYFKSTKDAGTHYTQLLELMKEWVQQDNIPINYGVYFDKSTMDDIVCLEFFPGMPTVYLVTAEHGISILVCCPRFGNEMADIQSKEQAIKATAQDHAMAKALLLEKKDP